MSKRDEHTKQVKENILQAADELLTKQGIEAVISSHLVFPFITHTGSSSSLSITPLFFL